MKENLVDMNVLFSDIALVSEILSIAPKGHTDTNARPIALWMLMGAALRDSPGDIVECGVYKGQSAFLLSRAMRRFGSTRRLHLFDTFCGMPEAGKFDNYHKAGDFSDTSEDEVASAVPEAILHPGVIPESLSALGETQLAFVHMDLDLYAPTRDAIHALWPLVTTGGIMLFDDYAYSTAKGVKKAVDEFFGPDLNLLYNGNAFVQKEAA